MKKQIWLMLFVLVSLLVSCLLPYANAETFKIGKKVSESELDSENNKLIYFDSGNIIYSHPDYKDYLPLIFDGNESTGIDHDFGNGHGWMNIDLMFPYSYDVRDITVKPSFNGSSSNYSLQVFYGGTNIPKFADEISIQKTFKINCPIKGIRLEINNGGTNHFYFNDIIINYTSSKSSSQQKEIKSSPQIFKIGKKISESENNTWNREYVWGGKLYYFSSGCMLGTKPIYIDYIKLLLDGNESTGMNHSFGSGGNVIRFSLVFPYPCFVNNITFKPSFEGNASEYYTNPRIYSGPFSSSLDIYNKKEKTYEINGTLSAIEISLISEVGNQFYFNDIIINYTPNSSYSDNYINIQNQINKLSQDIILIREEIKNSNLSGYDDTNLRNEIEKIKQEISENIILKQEVNTLTLKLENVTSEIEKLTEEIQNLEGKKGSIDGSKNEFFSQYTTNIIFVVVLIILLLIILRLSIIAFKRKRQDIEEQKIDNILVGKITHEMLTNYRIKDTKLSDDDYKMLLEIKFQEGKMSKETYDYMKKFLNDLNKNKDLKSRKK